MSYRIWWLIAFCALAIGLATEFAPADEAAPGQSEASAAASTPVAARRAGTSGG